MAQQQGQCGVWGPSGEEGSTQQGSGGKQRSAGSGAQVDAQGRLCRAVPGTEVGRDSEGDGASR